MSQQQGSNVKIIGCSEWEFKTVAAGSGVALTIPFVSESLRLNRNLISSNTIRSDRNPQQPVRGNVDVAGDVTFELAHQHGLFLHHAFGSYTAASGSSMATHTFKIGSLPTGLSLEKQFTDITGTQKYFQYTGCKVNSFKVSVKPEGMIEASVSIMGANEILATSSFDASAIDIGHDPWDGFQAVITEGGATIATVTQVDFELNNNLDGSSYVIDGTGKRYSIPAGTAKVTGTLTALFDSVTLYNKAINNTESSLVITLTKGTGAGTAGNEKLTFTIDELIYKPQAPVVGGPQGVVVELPFESYYRDGSNASAITAVLLSSRMYY